MTENASQSARARVRAALTSEILDAARAELADKGAADLSVRAVARRLGMVPSALYRYFPSRDLLLTALIVEAYEAVGAAAGTADDTARAAGASPMERWLAVCSAVRAWAGGHPRRWALVYGSPVPGYRAPEDTIEAASLVARVMARILVDAGAGPAPAAVFPPPPAGMAAVVAPVRDLLLPGCRAEQVVAALMVWTQLIGTVSLELFGHYEGTTTDFDAVFLYAMETAGRLAGLDGL